MAISHCLSGPSSRAGCGVHPPNPSTEGHGGGHSVYCRLRTTRTQGKELGDQGWSGGQEGKPSCVRSRRQHRDPQLRAQAGCSPG